MTQLYQLSYGNDASWKKLINDPDRSIIPKNIQSKQRLQVLENIGKNQNKLGGSPGVSRLDFLKMESQSENIPIDFPSNLKPMKIAFGISPSYKMPPLKMQLPVPSRQIEYCQPGRIRFLVFELKPPPLQ